MGKLFNDAKRRNLYLTSSGAAVGDFGSVMEKGKIPPFLTLDYASPEQLADLPCFEKSDVFMLAQVLYRLATGLEVVNFSLQNGLNYGELKQTVLNQTETTFSTPNSVRDIRNHLEINVSIPKLSNSVISTLILKSFSIHLNCSKLSFNSSREGFRSVNSLKTAALKP